MDEVKRFLESVNLEKWYDMFEKEEVDMDSLLIFSDDDLKEIGMDKKGPRVKLLKAINKYNISKDVIKKETERETVLNEIKDADNGKYESSFLTNATTNYGIEKKENLETSSQENEAKLETTESESDENDKYEGIFSKYNSWNAEEEMEETNPSNQEKEAEIESIKIQSDENNKFEGVFNENGSGDADEEKEETNPVDAASLLNKIASRKSVSKLILTESYERISQLLQLLQTSDIYEDLQYEIKTEYGDILPEIKARIQDLQNDECPIVITGETSAGKSSFVNVLLGADLLPTSALTCTSTICRIYNKPEKKVYVTDITDQRTQVAEFETSARDLAALRYLLKQYVSVRPNQKSQEGYKYVDIYWPIPNLHGDIVIVDTPGIGPDHQNLTDRLYSYLPNALAFIYVLNTPNAGGVQSDRILQIQREIAKHLHQEKEFKFDPKRAIFICNKWDQIYEDPEEVFESVRSQLSQSWIGFDNSKLFKMSTLEAHKSLKEGTPSRQFKEVLKAIESMLPAAIENKIHRHTLWQQTLMEGLLQKLAVRVISTLKSKEEKKKHLKKVNERLIRLHDNVSTIFKHIEQEIDEKCLDFSNSLFEHMTSLKTTSRMFSWTSDDLPEFDTMDKNEEYIKNDIKKKVDTELRYAIYKNVECLQKDIMTLIQDKLYDIDKESVEIDALMLNKQDLPLKIDDLLDYFAALDLQLGSKFLLTSSFLACTVFSLTVGVLLGPIGLVALVVSLGFGLQLLVSNAKVKIDKSKEISNYKQDKVGFVKRKAMKYLTRNCSKEYFNTIGHTIAIDAKEKVLQCLADIITKPIEAKKMLIANIIKDMRTPYDIRKKCQQTETMVKPVYGHFKLAHIKLFGGNICTDTDVRMKKEGDGLEVKQKEEWVQATATVKSGSSDNKQSCEELAEIIMFSQYMHENVLRIYGISTLGNCADKGLVIYSEKMTCSLDEMAMKDDFQWKNSRKILLDVLDGLSYLHDRGFAHKNLKLESILILKQDENIVAKVSMGVTMEPSKLTGPILGIPIIIAPEVKNGEPSGLESDIYQFGFILWECLFKKRAFCEEGRSVFPTYEKLYEVIQKTENPLPPFQGNRVKDLNQLIKKCCLLGPEKRPTAKLAKISFK